MNRVNSVARVHVNKLYPASYYARPAIAPLVVGPYGTVGQAQQQNAEMYKYTLQQMAMSPFAVNSQEYMKRIREEYGYVDDGSYDTLGTIGGIVGAGVGAYIGLGGWRGFRDPTVPLDLRKPKSIVHGWRQPFQEPTFTSKRQTTSDAFRQHGRVEYNKLLTESSDIVENYNSHLKVVNELKDKVNKYNVQALNDYQNFTEQIKNINKEIKKVSKELTDIEAQIKTKKTPELITKQENLIKSKNTLKNNKSDLLKQRKSLNVDPKTIRSYKMDTDGLNRATALLTDDTNKLFSKAANIGADATNLLDDAITAAKPLAKIASSFTSVASTVMDTVSLGLNTAGAVQAFNDDQYLHGALYTTGAIGDAVSIAGDVITATTGWTGVGAVVGYAVNIIGTVMSAASGAILGFLTGQTIGHSLSPEGQKAQQLFTKNLTASISSRPISTVATVLSMMAVPALSNLAGRVGPIKKTDPILKKILKAPARLFYNTTKGAFGNYIRSTASMFLVQGVQALTSPIDEAINPVSDNPEDVNFVSAFSLVGDLNDNLFGATARKATLIGLAKGDPKAQTDALARAWGFSDTDTYYSPTFDDVRQALGWELSPIGNSLFSTIGEVLVDPQNLSEIAQVVSTEKLTKDIARASARILNMERARQLSNEAIDTTITDLLFQKGINGEYIKQAYVETKDGVSTFITKKQYEAADKTKAKYELIDLYEQNGKLYKREYDKTTSKPKDVEVVVPKKVYNSYEYKTNLFGDLDYNSTKYVMEQFVRGYLEDGEDGLSKAYINLTTGRNKGSSTKFIDSRVNNIVPALSKFIESIVKGTYAKDFKTVVRNVNDLSKTEREKYVKAAIDIYSYHSQKGTDTTLLLTRLFKEFNLTLNDTQLTKLYYQHAGFKQQMDLIQQATGTINNLANPILWGIHKAFPLLGDFFNTMREKISDEKKQKIMRSIEETEKNINTITQKTINEIKEKIRTKYIKNYSYELIEKDLLKATPELPEVQQYLKEHQKVKQLLEDLKEQEKLYKENAEKQSLKIWTQKSKSGFHIEISKENVKDVEQRIKELESKQSLTSVEKDEYDTLIKAHLNFKWNTITHKTLANICAQYSTLLLLTDTISQESTKHLYTLISQLNKFNRIATDYFKVSKNGVTVQHAKVTPEKAKQFNEELNATLQLYTLLGLDIEVDGTVRKPEDVMKLIIQEPDAYTNLRVKRRMNLTEALTIKFNELLQRNPLLNRKYGNNVLTSLEIIGLQTKIESILPPMKDWVSLSDTNKIEYLKTIIAEICKHNKEYSADYGYLATDTVLLEIKEYLDTTIKYKRVNGYIEDTRALVDVTPTYLRGLAFQKFYKDNEDNFKVIADQVKVINTQIAEIEKYKDEDFKLLPQYIKIYTDAFNISLQNSDMYQFIKSFLYTSKPEANTRLFIDQDFLDSIPNVDPKVINDLKKNPNRSKITTLISTIANTVDPFVKAYETQERMDAYNGFMVNDPTDKDQAILVTNDGTEMTEASIGVSTAWDEYVKQDEEEFEKRKNQRTQVEQTSNNLTDKVKEQNKHIDKIPANIEIKHIGGLHNVQYTDDLKEAYYVLHTLTNPEKYNAVIFEGTLRINLRPTTLVDQETGKHILFTKLDKDIVKTPGYRTHVEKNMESLIYLVLENKIKHIRLKATSKALEIDDIKKYIVNGKPKASLVKDLTDAYLAGTLYIEVNNKIQTATGKTRSQTGEYYARVLRKSVYKLLHIAVRNNEAYAYDSKYNTLKEYIEALGDLASQGDTKAKNFLIKLYKDAQQDTYKKLVYDKGLAINSQIKTIRYDLEHFELQTFKSTRFANPTVARDIPIKVLSVDATFKELLNSIANFRKTTENGTIEYDNMFTTMLSYIHKHITESHKRSRKIYSTDFISVSSHNNDITFISKNGDKVSLEDLVLDYHITLKDLETILHATITPDQLELRAKIKERFEQYTQVYNNLYGVTINSITEDEYVQMIKTAQPDEDEASIRKAYQTIKTHWAEAELYAQFMFAPNARRKSVQPESYYYSKEIHDVYATAVTNFYKQQPITYNGITYKVDGKLTEPNRLSDLESYFLLSVLASSLDQSIKMNLLENVFFYDFKTVKGKASVQDLVALRNAISMQQDYIETVPADRIDLLEYATARLYGLNWALKYNEALNKGMKSISKKNFIKQACDGTLDPTLLLGVYYQGINTSDPSKYLPVFTETGEAIVVKKAYASRIKEGIGLGSLNIPIAGRFMTHLKNNVPTRPFKINNVNYNVLTSGSSIVIVTNDPTVDIVELKNNISKQYKYVFVASPQQLEELATMIKNKEIIQYNTYEAYKQEETEQGVIKNLGEIKNQINVKGSRVVTPAYMHDLHLITKYLKKDGASYERLLDYIISSKYTKLYESYSSRTELLNTPYFEKIEKASQTTQAFFEFIEHFRFEGKLDTNLLTLAEYFTNDVIKYKNYDTNTLTWHKLKDRKLGKRTYAEIMEEAINDLHNKYKDTDININFDNVLSKDLMEGLFNLESLINVYLNKVKQSTKYSKELTTLLKQHTSTRTTDLIRIQIKNQQDITHSIYKDYIKYNQDNPDKQLTLTEYCQHNAKLIEEKLNTKKLQHQTQLINLKDKRVDLKTMRHIIETFNKIKSYNPDQFDIIKIICRQTDIDLNTLINTIMTNKQLTEEQAYMYAFKNIFYPLVQNIALDFNIGMAVDVIENMLNDLNEQYMNFFAPELEQLQNLITDPTVDDANTLYKKAMKILNNVYNTHNEFKKAQPQIQQGFDTIFKIYYFGRIDKGLPYKKAFATIINALIDIMVPHITKTISPEQLGYDPSILKNRNYYIRPYHFNKYEYIDSIGLRKDRSLIYKNNKTRDEQDTVSLAEFVAGDTGIDKQVLQNIIRSFALGLTYDYDLQTAPKKILNNVNTISELNRIIMLNDPEYSNTLNIIKQTVPQELDAENAMYMLYNKALTLHHVLSRRSVTSEQIDNALNNYIDEAAKYNITGDQFEKILNSALNTIGTDIYENTFYNIILSVHNKSVDLKGTTTKKEIINMTNSYVLNNDIDFMNYIRTEIKKHKNVRYIIKTPTVKYGIENCKTLHALLNILKEETSEINKPQLLALLLEINELKTQYKNIHATYKNDKGEDTPYSWDYAVKYLEEVPNYTKAKQLKSLEFGKVFKENDDDGTNVFKDVSLPLRTAHDITRQVKALNNNLDHMIIPRTYTTTKDLDPLYTAYQESGINLAVRKIQHDTTAPLFKDTDMDTDVVMQASHEFKRTLTQGHTYLTAELAATSIDNLITVNKTYYDIAKLFTDAYNILDPTATDFITIGNITRFLRILKQRTENTKFYLGQYRVWKNTEAPELTKALEDIESHFKNKSFLIDMTVDQVRAFFGYLYYWKYNTKDLSSKQKEITDWMFEEYNKTFTVKHQKAESLKTKMLSIARANNIDEDTKIKRILDILYSTDEEKQKHESDIRNLIEMSNINNIKELTKHHKLHDTFEAANYNAKDVMLNAKNEQAILEAINERRQDIVKEIDTIHKKLSILKTIMTKKEKTYNTLNTYEQKEIKIDDKIFKYNELQEPAYNYAINTLTKQQQELETELYTKQQELELLIQEREIQYKLYKFNFVTQTDYIDVYKAEVDKKYSTYIKETEESVNGRIQYIDKYYPDLKSKLDKHIDAYNKQYEDDYRILNLYLREYKNTNEALQDTDLIEVLKLEYNTNDIKEIEEHINNFYTILKDMNTYTTEYCIEEYIKEIKEQKNPKKIKLIKSTIQTEANKYIKAVRKLQYYKYIRDMYINKTIFTSPDSIIYEELDQLDWGIIDRAYAQIIHKESKNFKKAKSNVSKNILQTIAATHLSEGTLKKIRDTIKTRKSKYKKQMQTAFEQWAKAQYVQNLVVTKDKSIDKYDGILLKVLKEITKEKENLNIKLQIETDETKLDQLKTDLKIAESREKRITDLRKVLHKKYELYKQQEQLQKSLKNYDVYTDEEYTNYYSQELVTAMKELHIDTDSELTEESIKYIIEQLNATPEHKKEIKELRETIAQLKDKITHIKTHQETINNHVYTTERIKELENEYEQITSEYNEQREDYENAQKHVQVSTYNKSNSNLYALYSNINKETTDIVKHVITRAIKDGVITQDKLNEIQKTTGTIELHNPVVDTLITLYNYIYQHGAIVNDQIDITKVPEHLIVMDMETVRDGNNSPNPYEITIVDFKVINGQIVTDIATAFYNNIAFNDGTLEAPGPLLKQFIKDQTQIYTKENPNITQEEINLRLNTIINKHKNIRNTLPITQTILTKLTQAQCPIIAHNGKKFDFANFDKFVNTWAERLLLNEYTRMLYSKEAIDNIFIRAGLSDVINLEQLPDATKLIEDIIKSTDPSDLESKNLERIIDSIFNKQIEEAVIRKFDECANALGIPINTSHIRNIRTNPDSKYNQVRNYCLQYIQLNATSPERLNIKTKLAELLNVTDLKELDNILNKIENDFRQYVTGQKTRTHTISDKQKVIQKVLEVLHIDKAQWNTYDEQQRLTVLALQIKSAEDFIEQIINNPNAVQDMETHIKSQQDLLLTTQQECENIREQIRQLDEEQKITEQDQIQILNNLKKLYDNINKATRKTVARGKTLLYKNKDILNTNAYKNNNDELQYTLTALETYTKQALFNIQFILNGYTEGLKDPKLYLDNNMLNIEGYKNIEQAIEDIQLRQKELIEFKTKLNIGDTTYWDTIKNKVLQNSEHVIKTTLDKLRINVEQSTIKNDLQDLLNIIDESTYNNAYTKFIEIIKNNPKLKTQKEIQNIIDIMDKKGILNTNFKVLNNKNSEPDAKLYELYNTCIDHELERLNKTLAFIHTAQSKTINVNTLGSLENYITSVLKRVLNTEDEINKMETQIIEESLFRSSMTSMYYGDPKDEKAKQKFQEEFIKNASTLLPDDSPEVQALKEDGINVIYNNPKQGNDIEGFTLSSKYIWYDETDNGISIYTIDEDNLQLQSLFIPYTDTKELNTSTKTWHYNFTYNYKQRGRDYGKVQANTVPVNITKIKNVQDLQKLVTPISTGDIIQKPIDTSMTSIVQLYNFVKTKLTGIKSKAGLLKVLESNAVNVRKAELHKFERINLSNKVRKQFADYLVFIQNLQENRPRMKNLENIYRSIYNSVMGNLNAIVPGQYLNLIPDQVKQNIMWRYTEEGAKKFNIDPKNVTESNMGKNFNPADELYFDPQFSENTNYIRTILAHGLFTFRYTPLGVVNDLMQYADKNDLQNLNISELLNNETEDNIKAKAIQLTKKDRHLFKNKTEYNTYVDYITQQLKTEQEHRKNLLIEKYNIDGQEYITNMFTPNVGTPTMQENFRRNVFHPNGINVTVAFADDPRAFEDTMLIDEDDAIALGADATNKLWLKFGFKGGIRPIKGLRQMYGATIVASRASVQKRGANGLYLEQAFNKLRDYRLGILDKNDVAYKYLQNIKNIEKQIPIFKTSEEANKAIKESADPILVYLVNGKLYTDPKVNNEYFNTLLNKDMGTNVDYRVLITDTIKDGETFVIKNPASETNEDITYTYQSIKNDKGEIIQRPEIIKGRLYIVLDSEHIARHAQSLAQIKATEDKTLAYAKQDIRGRVLHGGTFSNTVEQSIAMTVGYNWVDGIIGAETHDQALTKYQNTMRIVLKGFKAFDNHLVKTDNGTYDIDKSIDAVVKVFSEAYRPFVKSYCGILNRIHNDGKSRDADLNVLETKLKTKALESTQKDTGLAYSTRYTKYLAARNQIVANANIDRGTIKVPLESWEALKSLDEAAWITYEPYTKISKETFEKDYKNDKVQLYKKLQEEGIYETANGVEQYELINPVFKTIRGIKRLVYVEDIKFKTNNLQQTIAYVIAIRSPVQDYKATPVLKITGIVQHSGIECAPVMYKLMGADNDGDTAAFIPVKYKAVLNEDGVLRKLDSTKIEYFKGTSGDPDKLVTGDLFAKRIEDPQTGKVEYEGAIPLQDSYKTSDLRYANIGKFALPTPIRDLKDQHYLYVDLIVPAGGKAYLETLYRDAQNAGITVNSYTEFKGSEAHRKRWVLTHLWYSTDSKNPPKEYHVDINTFYKDPKYYGKYYDEHKQEIQKLQTVEKYLQINGLTEYASTAIEQTKVANTLSRGRRSKLLIGIVGGYRKKIYLNTSLSIFPTLNQDEGKLWETYYNVDPMNLTVDKLLYTVFPNIQSNQYKTLCSKTLEELKNKYIDPKLKDAPDIDLIIKYLQERLKEVIEIEEHLPDIYKLLFKQKTITWQDVKEICIDYQKDEDLLLYMPIFKEHIMSLTEAQRKQTTLNEIELTLLKSYYFSRFDKDTITDVKKLDEIVDVYTKQILNQYIFTRAKAAQTDRAIQLPISDSKHGDIRSDSLVLYQQMDAEAKAIAESMSTRKIYMGNNIEHLRALLMDAEYNKYERRKIRFTVSDEVKTLRADARQNAYKQQRILPSMPTQSLKNAINSIIRNDICGETMIAEDVELFKTHYKIFAKILTDFVNQTKSTLDINKLFNTLPKEKESQLIEAIKVFEELDIPLYKIARGIKLAYGFYKEAKKYKPNLTKVNLDLIENSEQIYLLSIENMRQFEFKYAHDNASANQKYFVNYITNKDNPSELLVTVMDDDNNIFEADSLTMTKYGVNKYDNYMDKILAASEQYEIYDIDKALVEPLSQRVNEQILTDLNFDRSQSGSEMLQLLKHALVKYKQRLNSQQIIKDQIEINKKTKTKDNQAIDLLYKQLYGYHFIKKDATKITELQNKLFKIKKQTAKLQKEIQNKQNKIQQLEIEIKQLQDYLKHNETKTPDYLKQQLENEININKEKQNKIYEQLIETAMIEHIGSKIYSLDNDPDTNSIRLLSQQDIKNFQEDLIMQENNRQHPFAILVDAFRRTTETGNTDINWDAMYKYIKDNYRYIRITEVVKPDDTEGLAKKFIDHVSIKDTKKYKGPDGKEYDWNQLNKIWNKLTKKERKQYLQEHNKIVEFETFEDLQNKMKECFGDFKITINGEEYDSLDDALNINDFFTPTLKQLRIKSPEDLKRIYKIILNQGENAPSIGITFINDILDGIEAAYKPYRVGGKGERIIGWFNYIQKAMMRLSAGFLFRNAVDTFNQLISDMYLEQGLTPLLLKPREIFKYIRYGERVYDAYTLLNEERMLTLKDVLDSYNIIKQTSDTNIIKEELERVTTYLDSYIKQANITSNLPVRIQSKLDWAKTIYKKYTELDYNNIKDIQQLNEHITQFLLNINFAEYYLFYDNKNGIRGLRVDSEDSDIRKPTKKLQRIISQQDDLFKDLLFEISAFMNTNAQVDMFKQKQYQELFTMTNQKRYELENSTTVRTIKDIENEINMFRHNTTNQFAIWLSNNVKDMYQHITDRTENLARILGFIFNKELYGKSFNESVQLSLKTWFNYGQRSPLEVQLSYDIPYISFPLRSITNWSTRLLDPRYARLMDDIIDGVYGQYADDDGMYSEWEQFMIRNGWVPITKNIGIRAGSGAFDILNLLSDTPDNLAQRRNPILRGLSEFISSGDLSKAVEQLASFGVIKRASNAVLPASVTKGTMLNPKAKEKTLATSISMFFEYNDDTQYQKYIPYKYRNNNGRWIYYENIYKDWFNKYGRMRKPTKDPVQLVNNIQWKQYLNYKRNQYRR